MKKTTEDQKTKMPEDDSQPLLKGIDDANEEVRQRDRINEQENNAINGKVSNQQT